MSTSGLPPQLTSTSTSRKGSVHEEQLYRSPSFNAYDTSLFTPTPILKSTNSLLRLRSPSSPPASGSDALAVSLLNSETQRRVNLPSSSAAPTRPSIYMHVIPKTASDISPTATHFPRGFRTRVPCKHATATAPSDRISMQTRCQVCLFPNHNVTALLNQEELGGMHCMSGWSCETQVMRRGGELEMLEMDGCCCIVPRRRDRTVLMPVMCRL